MGHQPFVKYKSQSLQDIKASWGHPYVGATNDKRTATHRRLQVVECSIKQKNASTLNHDEACMRLAGQKMPRSTARRFVEKLPTATPNNSALYMPGGRHVPANNTWQTAVLTESKILLLLRTSPHAAGARRWLSHSPQMCLHLSRAGVSCCFALCMLGPHALASPLPPWKTPNPLPKQHPPRSSIKKKRRRTC